MEAVDNFVKPLTGTIRTDKYMEGLLFLFVASYLPKLSMPEFMKDTFELPVVQIIVLTLFVWSAKGLSPSESLIIAAVFYGAIKGLSGKKIFEMFQGIDPVAHIYPECKGMSLEKLKAQFGGDDAHFESVVREIGVPYNVDIDDENAPLIATHLINAGYSFDEGCALPGSLMPEF